MTDPTVSIVVPTYNRAGYVESAVNSLLEQDYPSLEVIAIDDGSADETSAVLERIAERTPPERFRWWRHDNVGQSETLNRGWAEARGDLLGYLSSDDVLLPGATRRLVEVAVEHPDAEVVYPWYRVIDEDDRTVRTIRSPQHTFVDAVRWGLCMPGAGTLFRRSLLDRVGGWNPDNSRCPDFEWYLRARDARFCLVPEVLATWRAHDGSASLTPDLKMLDERIRILDEIFDDPEVAPEVEAVRAEAYAAALVSGAMALEGPDLGAPGRRFAVFDRIGSRISSLAAAVEEAGLMATQAGLRSAEQQVAAQQEIIEQLRQTVGVLEDATHHRDARIVDLEREVARASAELEERSATAPSAAPPTPNPTWLRVGRRLTPTRARHRVGVLVHRLRNGRR
jgi:hypothetical protein